ncbi:MAG TPA: uracil-DNA glycosylase [Armatimonadota bacterium]|nr:uracil-DNA glycosylase [Armatimonadota bacterium]
MDLIGVIGIDSCERLAAEIRGCVKCRLSETRIQAVTGEYQAQARILLLGESPGAAEDRSGRNFCGPSGKFLNRCLSEAGLSRDDVNVAPILHCHPPGNRNPLPDEASSCLPYLHRYIALMDPAILVVMGSVAARWYLGEKSIAPLVGTWREFNGRPTLITYHPAAGMRFPAKGKVMMEHFRMLSSTRREARTEDGGRRTKERA